MSGARGLTLAFLVLLCALPGVLTFGGAPAGAAITHKYLSQITEGQLGEEGAMTFDAGDLYLLEGFYSESVEKFDASSGAFISRSAHPSGNDFVQGVAVGHSTGETETYVTGNSAGGGAVDVFGPTGNLQNEWNGADAPGGFPIFGIDAYAGVAVDNSANPLTEGDVYVSVPEANVLDVFEPTAGGGEKYLTQLVGFKQIRDVTVNQSNGDVLVAETEAIQILEPTALKTYALVRRFPISLGSEGIYHASPVAVDGNGEIYVVRAEQGAGGVDQYNSEGAFLHTLTGTPSGGFDGVQAVAVDPVTNDVYVRTTGAVDVFGPNVTIPDVKAEPASNVKSTSARLNGTVNPDKAGEATCRFIWGTGASPSKVAPCEPEDVPEGGAPVPVHAALSGLQRDTTYHYELEATNKANGLTNVESGVVQFATPGPRIDGESVSNAAATSATLEASLEPNNAPTTYYFQYGTSASYGAEVPVAPGASIGSGKGDVEVAQHVQGLLAGTVYHYRVVAISEVEPGQFEIVEGADETFSTQPTGSAFALLDGRQWEMVSPPEKFGAELLGIGFGAAGTSVNGDAITYTSNLPTEANPQGFAEQSQTLALRGPEGWASRDISPPHRTASGPSLNFGQQYRVFSEDLSLSVVHPFAGLEPALSPEASEQTAYLHTDYLNGNVGEPCLAASMSCYRPLVTGKPGFANVSPGISFGEEVPGEPGACFEARLVCGPEVRAVTPDLSHILVDSNAPLLPGGANLFEWAGGKLKSIGHAGSENSEVSISPRHGISVDGSRVIYESIYESPIRRGIFMRDVSTGALVHLDAVQGGTGAGNSEPQIQGASSDGSKVYFTDPQNLTADATGNTEYGNLYECEMVEAEGKLQCKLSDLTPGAPRVRGGVVGISEDGSYVYFVAEGALAEGAVEGADNLYVFHGGATKLVAILSGQDGPDWAFPPDQTARVSSDGRLLTFMSQQDLTGYVTRDAITGKPDEEVYLYDAVTGELKCASCDPTGSRPIGIKNPPEPGLTTSGSWGTIPFAANVPEWTDIGFHHAFTQSRYLSDSGRLFFNSDDALVPQDVNGTEDVYEYEPPGVGSCTTASTTYSERSGGCVDLISSGTSGEESGFLDASGSGGDVFFLTVAKLAPQDFDTALDVYDAHECRASAPCYAVPPGTPPPCDTGDACKSSPTPQPAIFGSPSSATFSGAGNIAPSASAPGAQPKGPTRAQKLARALKACHRKRGRRRTLCERQARTRYAATKSRVNNAKKRGGGV